MPSNMDKLLSAASEKLGTTPEKLKEALEKGNMNEAVANMSEQDKARLNSLLKNKELMEKLMNSKQAQEIKKNLDE